MSKALKMPQVLVSKEGEIFGFHLSTEPLCVLFHEATKMGGAVLLSKNRPIEESLKDLIETMTVAADADPEEMVAKVIAPQDEIDQLKSQLEKLRIFVQAARPLKYNEEVEVYFYTDTGRLRVGTTHFSKSSSELPKLEPGVANIPSSAPPSPPPATPKSAPSLQVLASQPIRVLIIDDSPTIRKVLSKVLDEKNGFKVVGECENPVEAEKFLKDNQVDVVTLDINMPIMDGITYLEKTQGKPHPPIVVISAINMVEAVKALRCFELGAVGYIEKPSNFGDINEAERIRGMLRTAAGSQIRSLASMKKSKDVPTGPITYQPHEKYKDLILIGASTGGTQAITALLEPFPVNSPPVVIVQHIPPVFSAAFAERLNGTTQLKCKEGVNGEELAHGHVYIAPGGTQMRIRSGRNPGKLEIEITDDAPVNRHKPSVDYLFHSAVNLPRNYRAVAALLTGMGADGAKGLKALKDKNIFTIAESEETCVVYGMPREAVKIGGASEVLPLPKIAWNLFHKLQNGSLK